MQEIAFFEKKVNFHDNVYEGQFLHNQFIFHVETAIQIPHRSRETGPAISGPYVPDVQSDVHYPTYRALYWALLDTTCRAGMHVMEIGVV